MCGIAGYLSGQGGAFDTAATLRRMADAIAHRGPDATGMWRDDDATVGLAHNRLAILDLSPAGAQPMLSADGRWAVSFNGEIYNFEALKARLPGTAWRSQSDTEVLVELIASLGVRDTLELLNGMFAFAAWDRQERKLWLARDRLGEKPLYMGWSGSTFLFGSELKALMAFGGFERRIDRVALGLYLDFGYVPAPYAIFAGIEKLPPGHFAVVDAAAASGTRIETLPYWTAPLPTPDAAYAGEDLDALIENAVVLRMRSDVPMGAFLSGGIDSSVVTALMQKNSARPVRTFSIGFTEAQFDESAGAAAVAAHLGTDHMLLQVTPADALATIPSLPDVYDEPFADSSQIPTLLLARLARAHVTVALSGDGGDELFTGYARYLVFDDIWKRLGPVPQPLRAAAAQAVGSLAGIGRSLAPSSVRQLMSPERVTKMARCLKARDAQGFYEALLTVRDRADDRRGTSLDRPIVLDQFDIGKDFASPELGMGYLDTRLYLPDDILVKVDRATMAVALEGRIPLLDHRIVEAAARLPIEQRIVGGIGKQVLRRILYRHVPAELVDRPKQGFAVPLADWLRGPLRDWAEALLAIRSHAVADALDWGEVDRLWASHLSGTDRSARLWSILMLQAWVARWSPA